MSEVLVCGQSVPDVTHHDAETARDRNVETRCERLLIPAVCALLGSAWSGSRYGGYTAGSGVGDFNGWDAARQTRDLAAAKALIGAYLSGVQRVAQFRRYTSACFPCGTSCTFRWYGCSC